MCVTRRKQLRPGIASNDNTMHVPNARSSADVTKRNQTPTQYTLAKERIFLQMATPRATSSQRMCVVVQRSLSMRTLTRNTAARDKGKGAIEEIA